MNKTIISRSDVETQKIGEEFAKTLKAGDTVFLFGDLGFGKTTFVKGVARGLGIKSRIISPTFTIIRTHGKTHHIDLYRVDNYKQLEELGLDEILKDPRSIKLIEWPEKLEKMPKKRWEVRFEMDKKDTRVRSQALVLADTRTININEYE